MSTNPSTSPRITPFLWFADQAEEAASFYVSVFAAVFPDSRIASVSRYTEAQSDANRREPGSAMTVSFVLDGMPFTALNGGPLFTFSEAVSFVIRCADQAEVDHFWDALTAGGDPAAQQCGWLKDRFGVSWQVVPEELFALLGDPDPERARRATAAMLQMKKIDIAALERAAAGG